MESLKELITDNLSNYPEWAEYNDVVIDLISSYKQKRPDICIEGCKSLIEGICKFIYLNIDKENANLNQWRHQNLQNKFKKATDSLRLKGYEDEFLKKNYDLIQSLGQIRNDRGDISHGQSYPKEFYSDTDFGRLVALWTEGLCYFMLSRYIIYKQKEYILPYTKEQYDEFDNYLDDSYSDIGISYSRALKEQDPLKYEESMDKYFYKVKEDDNNNE
jgi:hypothetical protein